MCTNQVEMNWYTYRRAVSMLIICSYDFRINHSLTISNHRHGRLFWKYTSIIYIFAIAKLTSVNIQMKCTFTSNDGFCKSRWSRSYRSFIAQSTLCDHLVCHGSWKFNTYGIACTKCRIQLIAATIGRNRNWNKLKISNHEMFWSLKLKPDPN